MKLYVGNLPFSLGENDIQEVFAEYGEVASVKLITDKMSGRKKGFGFVEMANDADAQKAINELNGKDLEGRNIIVNEAREPEPRSNSGFKRNDRY